MGKNSLNNETEQVSLFFLGDKNKSHQHFAVKMKEGGDGKLF